MFSKLLKILHSEDMNMTRSSVVAFLEPYFNAHCTNHTFCDVISWSCAVLSIDKKSQWNFTAQLLLLHVYANQIRFTFLEYEQLTQYIFILIGGWPQCLSANNSSNFHEYFYKCLLPLYNLSPVYPPWPRRITCEKSKSLAPKLFRIQFLKYFIRTNLILKHKKLHRLRYHSCAVYSSEISTQEIT